MRLCTGCGEWKALDRFNKNNRTKDGIDYHCKQCTRAAQKRNWPAMREKRIQQMNDRNARLKAQFVELAGGRCQRCGYHEFQTGLEFHHVEPGSKDAQCTTVVHSGNFDRAYAELDKCAMLCSCCHQALTAGDWSADFVKRDGLGWTITDVVKER